MTAIDYLDEMHGRHATVGRKLCHLCRELHPPLASMPPLVLRCISQEHAETWFHHENISKTFMESFSNKLRDHHILVSSPMTRMAYYSSSLHCVFIL
jgi:hypothetical protein